MFKCIPLTALNMISVIHKLFYTLTVHHKFTVYNYFIFSLFEVHTTLRLTSIPQFLAKTTFFQNRRLMSCTIKLQVRQKPPRRPGYQQQTPDNQTQHPSIMCFNHQAYRVGTTQHYNLWLVYLLPDTDRSQYTQFYFKFQSCYTLICDKNNN